MMNTFTFPLFSKLPRELRDMIWDSALRPLEHGVHYFSVEESSYTGLPNENAQPAVELCSTESDQNLSTYMLTRGLLTSCKESRAAVERSRRYAQNKPSIITSKLDGRVQELFYYDSSDIIILRRGWGRTGHIVSDCLAIPESDKGHFGAPPRFPKHIGLEIELDDYLWLVERGHSPSNRSQQCRQVRYLVASIMDWVNHEATLYFIYPGNRAFTDYNRNWMKRGNLESFQIEGPVFNDGKYRYLPVLPSSCLETGLVLMFIKELKTLFRDIYKPDPCTELDSSLKVMDRQQIPHEKTTG